MGARRNVDPLLLLPPFTIAELLSRLGKGWKVPKANKFIPTAYWYLAQLLSTFTRLAEIRREMR